jgi:hypothetical protein
LVPEEGIELDGRAEEAMAERLITPSAPGATEGAIGAGGGNRTHTQGDLNEILRRGDRMISNEPNTSRPACRRSQVIRNNRVERFWSSEVEQR